MTYRLWSSLSLHHHIAAMSSSSLSLCHRCHSHRIIAIASSLSLSSCRHVIVIVVIALLLLLLLCCCCCCVVVVVVFVVIIVIIVVSIIVDVIVRQRDKSGHGKNQVSKARAGEHRWTDESGHGETPSGRWALTSWRVRTDRQVRMWKGSKWVRARAGEHRRMDESGCRKNPSERGALTTSAVHAADMFRPRLVQTNRDQDTERIWAGGTHFCKHRWTSQDVEREGLRWEKGREGRVA